MSGKIPTIPGVTDGRRIDIQESCFTSESLRSIDSFNETTRVLAGLTIPRTVAHTISELQMFGDSHIDYSADTLVYDLGLRQRQTDYLRQFTIRYEGSIDTILSSEEEVVANCFFSNYYTLATDEAAASEMFADNSSIAAIKGLHPKGLLLVSQKQLVHKPNKKVAKSWANLDVINSSVNEIAESVTELVDANNLPGNAMHINESIILSANRLITRLRNITYNFLNS